MSESDTVSTVSPSSATSAADAIADGLDHPLDPRYVTLQRRVGLLGVAFLSLVAFGAAFGAWMTRDWATLHPAVVFGAAGVVTLGRLVVSQWWPPLAYRYASYRLDTNGIEIRRGVLWRSITTVPRSRVQHTDVSQGPVERPLSLATLVIHTAGSHHAVVTVHGLAHERALRIREHLLPRREHDVV